MIEKILRAVKSSNKKRGRNITIGAVVGMLLSCTVVMGAEGDYLWIKNDGGVIEFSTNSDDKDGTSGDWGENPYLDNSWNGSIYINNITLSGTDNGNGLMYGYEYNIGYGLRLSGDLGADFNLENNGSISGSSVYGYGVYLNSSTMRDIINKGMMTGKSASVMCNASGIYLYNSKIGTIKNRGGIIGNHNNLGHAYGIYISSSIDEIINEGIITGFGTGGGFGIELMSSIGGIINKGIMTGSNYGMHIFSSGTMKNNISNTGVVYGSLNAIYNNGGTITNGHNYGLLASSWRLLMMGTVVFTDNCGLAFKIESDKYILDGDYSGEFGEIYHNIDVVMGYLEDNDGNPILNSPITEKYTIINAKAETKELSLDVIGTESLVLADGKLTNYNYSAGEAKEEIIDSNKKYILNGITNTLEVTGRHNELNNSVINALETAVVMDKDMTMLTLNNTVVNGNILGTTDISTVNIGGEGSTLTVNGDSVINTKDKTAAITVGGNNNAVTLEGNAIVNGEMKSTGKNTLNLNGTAEDGMNMLHNIDGFVNMNIDNSVTFFEDMTVTGTDTVTVKETGILNLRLKKKEDTTITYDDSSIPEATHSFSGTNGMLIKGTSEEEAGTLNFLTNGIGREILVDMKNIALVNMDIRASSIIDKAIIGKDYIHLGAGSDLDGIINPRVNKYNSLNKIYKSIYSSTGQNLDGLRDILSMTYLGENYDYNNAVDEKQLINLMTYLDSIYTGNPYSYSSELSRRSVGMFRDIVTENQFKPNLNNWLIMGGLTHTDGGTKDTYYGKNYYEIDSGSSSTNADMKLTGAYMLAKYGYSENTSLGLTLGGNKSEAKLDMSKVKGNNGYLGAFAENYRGNLTLKAGAGVQYSEYDADRAFGGYSYSDKYSDMTYDIYLNGRYSNPIGDNLFLEPYGTLSYTYIKQDGANEGSKTLAIETDSKSFDYTVGKIGLDLKKNISHSTGKSTLSAGVSYTKIFNGAEEEYITGRFKGGSDFDILVAHKNQHSIGLNAKYALELENGLLFDVKGTYSIERDSHNSSGKNRTKGEWIVGTGLGYKF